MKKAPASEGGRYNGPSEYGPGGRELSEVLQFGVGVRADFAVQVDFFVLRCGPFHGRRLLENQNDGERAKNTTAKP
jgi:hypothetical protein